MKIDARGSKKEAHRSNFARKSSPGGVKNGQILSLRASGSPGGVFSRIARPFSWIALLIWALGTILGSSWRVLGPFWVAFQAPGGHFWTFLGRPSRDLKNELWFIVFPHIWSLFSVLFFALCCLPCSVAGGVVHMQKAENSLVFVGRKPYAPCSGNARSNQLSGGARNKYRWKKELKKRTHGTRRQDQKMSIFEAQIAPKMDPGGFQKRVHKTVGN